MRYFILVATLTMLWSCQKDQSDKNRSETQPSPEIQMSFEKAFPKATNMYWEKENAFYQVHFRENEQKKKVLYNEDGKIVEIATQVEPSNLPAKIRQYILETTPSAAVQKAEKSQRDDAIYYEVIIEQGKQRVKMAFDEQGNFIETEENEEID